jgi:hypothetical protein
MREPRNRTVVRRAVVILALAAAGTVILLRHTLEPATVAQVGVSGAAAGRPLHESVPAVPQPRASPANRGTDSSISDLPHALTLVATSPATSGREGTVALGTDPRNPQTYEVGSILANGAVVEEIHADRVVLSRNGTRTTILANVQAGAQDEAAVIGGAGIVHAVDTVPTSGEQWSRYLRPQLVFEGRQIVGLGIVPGSQPEALDLLGLVAGDVVRSIEGKAVTSDSDWEPIERALSSGRAISVSIERNGGIMTLSLDGARLVKSEAARKGAPFPPLGS